MTDHLVARAADLAWSPPAGPLAGSPGLERLVRRRRDTPSVHTGFGLSRLAPGGAVPAHVHSYEESLFVLDGQVVVQTPGEAARLGPGDYGLIPVGVPHSLRNDGDAEARFARMSAPLPRPAHDLDTQLVPELRETAPVPADVRDPRTRRYGHIAAENMDPGDADAGASWRCRRACARALLVYSGISVKMMVDSDLGAVLSIDVHGAVRAERRWRARTTIRSRRPT